MATLSSAKIPSPEGEVCWEGLRVAWVFRPLGGECGGDGFRLSQSGGGLSFLIADAPGHGPQAARFWDRHGVGIDAAWAEFAAGGSLGELADAVDARLAASGDPEDYLCVSPGRWSGGALAFANCGYGTHTLARTAAGPWWAEPEALFGLKLGWVGPERRNQLPRGLVVNELEGVDRVILMTDALLGDDHADPLGTLEGLRALHERVSALPFEGVIPALLESAPEVGDDLTLIVLERT